MVPKLECGRPSATPHLHPSMSGGGAGVHLAVPPRFSCATILELVGLVLSYLSKCPSFLISGKLIELMPVAPQRRTATRAPSKHVSVQLQVPTIGGLMQVVTMVQQQYGRGAMYADCGSTWRLLAKQKQCAGTTGRLDLHTFLSGRSGARLMAP